MKEEEDPNKILEEFRENWRQELNQGRQNNESSADKLEVARTWFLEGSELERQGKVYDAMRYYRKACQLVPDIDFQIRDEIQQAQRLKSENKKNSVENVSGPGPSTSHEVDSDVDQELEKLMDHFNKTMAISIGYCMKGSSPGTISTGFHFSDLPVEILLFILKWVVSNDLDFKSLEQFSHVCRGFYLAARDQEVWKIACMKVWGINCGSINEIYPTFRDMFINRPRVNFHGCYITKITYLRYGENSFQDQFYRPVQLVEYYRFIRFFPDGKLAMFTSADDLQTSVNKMKNVQNFMQHKDILIGNFKLQDDNVIIVVNKNKSVQQKQKRKKEMDDFGNLTFFIELQICKTKRKFTKLTWTSYSVIYLI